MELVVVKGSLVHLGVVKSTVGGWFSTHSCSLFACCKVCALACANSVVRVLNWGT